MPAGGRIRFALSEEADGILLLRVVDNGVGIGADQLPRIFEPFFTTKPGTGTGLGLWVSDCIVRKHGGRIQVESQRAGEGQGTTFSVYLPPSAM